MRIDIGSQTLPRKRFTSFVEFISLYSIWMALGIGISLYIFPVCFISFIEYCFLRSGTPLVYNGTSPAGIFDLLYFNFITITTIGYGDLRPVGLGRVLSVVEGIIGIGIFGLLVSAIVTKWLSPRHNSIVFSRYGYYCTDEERFLLVFVNTTKTQIINVDMTSYFKLGGDWVVKSSIRAPFITKSVQTFFLDKVPLSRIRNELQQGDVFRFAISGSLGISMYSTAVQYYADEIIVIPNREELIRYDGFTSPDFKSVDIAKMFHYRPTGALTLSEYVNATPDIEP